MAPMRFPKEICITALAFTAGLNWAGCQKVPRMGQTTTASIMLMRRMSSVALRTHPTSTDGLHDGADAGMRTILQVLQQRPDKWWYVRVYPSRQEGWALSGQGERHWIECCVTASSERTPMRRASLLRIGG